jgi:hypothetical protein
MRQKCSLIKNKINESCMCAAAAAYVVVVAV